MSTPRIEINMDAHCQKCGKSGACQNGLCMGCNTKRILRVMSKRQTEIPGMEAPSHPQIDEACDTFIALKIKRKDLGEKIKEAELELVMAMHAKDLTSYRYDNTLIKIEPQEKVRIEDAVDPDADGD